MLELRIITDRIGELADEQVKAVARGNVQDAERITGQMRELLERQRELCRLLGQR